MTSTKHNRRGGTYIVVLMSVLIITTIGLGGVALVQAKERTRRTTAAGIEAGLLARSAVEYGMQYITDHADWRTKIGDGSAFLDMELGRGAASVYFIDPDDGDLTDNETDPVVIRGEGKVAAGPRDRSARQMIEITLNADPQPLAILYSAVHAAGLVEVPSGKGLSLSGGTVSSNYAVKNAGSIDGSALAPTVEGYGYVSGSKTTLGASMPMPPLASLTGYATSAVQLPAMSTLEKCVLSPGSNPWGAKHDDGLYVISPSGSFEIRRCRIHGTLVVLNNGNTTTIKETTLMEHARADYPVLLVYGDLVIENDSAQVLRESGSGAGTNLNPTGSPYGGVTDTDSTDQYPTELRGLVYATGTIQIAKAAKVVGAVISGSSRTNAYALQVAESAVVVYEPMLTELPPVGFTSGCPMVPEPASWTKVVEED